MAKVHWKSNKKKCNRNQEIYFTYVSITITRAYDCCDFVYFFSPSITFFPRVLTLDSSPGVCSRGAGVRSPWVAGHAGFPRRRSIKGKNTPWQARGIFIFMLVSHLAHAGLALATSLSSLVNAAILFIALIKKKYYYPPPSLLNFMYKIIASTVIMTATFYFAWYTYLAAHKLEMENRASHF